MRTMTRERYIKIRNNDHPIFNYYLELGGVIRDIKEFKKFFELWMNLYHPFKNIGNILINLDKFYKY